MPVELKIPQVGESVTEAQIGRWLKAEGEAVAKDETVAELETDKVNVELPAPAAGVLRERLKSEGDTVAVGDVIGLIEEGAQADAGGGATAPPSEETDTAEAPASPAPESAETSAGEEGDGPPRVMPAARRLLEEHGLSAAEVEASGPGGRLLKQDVQRHARETGTSAEPESAPKPPSASPLPAVSANGDREEEAIAMSPMRKRIAQRLVEAQTNAALLTTFNEVDMTNVMQLRKAHQESFQKRYDIKLGFMSFFIKASIAALREFPAINAEIRDDQIVYRNYYDVGVAVSTDRGLLVPVIRNAERLSFAEIELAIADFAERGRKGQIKLDELQGGTFTITNGGIFGSLLSTPIVNPPQSGVLGMHAIQDRPVARDGQVVIRPMMYLALTYDHRIVDGREAVTCLRRIAEVLEEPARMLLEA